QGRHAVDKALKCRPGCPDDDRRGAGLDGRDVAVQEGGRRESLGVPDPDLTELERDLERDRKAVAAPDTPDRGGGAPERSSGQRARGRTEPVGDVVRHPVGGASIGAGYGPDEEPKGE